MKAALVAALVLAAAPAHADDRVTAERMFRAGERAYRAQSFEAAAQNFEQAYKALPLPEIAFSAAQAYRRQYRIDSKASHVARAIELYRGYLDKVKTGGRVADAADALAEMQHELDKLIKSGAKVSPELAAEHTQLGVNVDLGDIKAGGMHEVEDAPAQTPTTPIAITIDGETVPPSTAKNVQPGPRVIHVEAAGYFAVDRTEKMTQGEYQMLDITLLPRPAKLAITTDDGARISIDGRPSAASGSTTLEVPAGKHLLAILRDGREPFARELVVTRGEQLKLDEPLHVTWKRRTFSRVFVAGTITGTVALTAGITALIADQSAASYTLKDRSPDIGDRYNRDIRIRDDAMIGVYTLGAATAVLGVAAALLYYTDSPSLEGVHVEAAATPGAAAAAVVAGHF